MKEARHVLVDLILPDHFDASAIELAHNYFFLQVLRHQGNANLRDVFEHILEPLDRCRLSWTMGGKEALFAEIVPFHFPKDASLEALEAAFSFLLDHEDESSMAYLYTVRILSVLLDAYKREVEDERLPGHPADIVPPRDEVISDADFNRYMGYLFEQRGTEFHAEHLAQAATRHFFVAGANDPPPDRFLKLAEASVAARQ